MSATTFNIDAWTKKHAAAPGTSHSYKPPASLVEELPQDADPLALALKAGRYFLRRCIEEKSFFNAAGRGTGIYSAQVQLVACLEKRTVESVDEEVGRGIERMSTMGKGGWE